MNEPAPDMADPVVRAAHAVAIMGLAGPSVGGLWLRARPSPARDRVLAELEAVCPEVARFGPETEDLALVGGVDVGASLAAGGRVLRAGLLARHGRLTLTGAERATPSLAARLGLALDAGGRCLVAIDEGAAPDEGLAPGLAARVGVFVDLDGLGLAEARAITAEALALRGRGGDWAGRLFPGELDQVLAEYSALLGVGDTRHLLATRAVARVLAALRGDGPVTRDDLDGAVGLVLAPRGRMPEIQPEVDESQGPDRDGAQPDAPSDRELGDGAAENRVTEAEAVRLPPALLELSASAPMRGVRGSGAGVATRNATRGRPLPSRPGKPGGRARIDPVATLRAAIPWQRLRPPSPAGQTVALRLSDIRIRRHEERSDRVVIFTVDASGSQAMARMSEAKGAVECLLAEAYRRRDQVALVAFRGKVAEVLLAPTRALVRARKALSGLPAGGATPLAAGLDAAASLALQAQGAGAAPVIVLLSDGRGNIARDGTADRTRAAADAEASARMLAAAGIESLILDTGRRPDAALEALARALGGTYLAMPFARARDMSAAVTAALDS